MEEKREQNTEEKKLLYFNCERFMYRENRNFGRRDKKTGDIEMGENRR